MSKNVLAFLSVFLLVAGLSCSSKDKKADEDSAAVAAGEPDANVSAKDMSFDPEGSDGGKISGLSTVNFEYDKATLTSVTRDLLKENANWIKGNDNVVVQIEGHCDTRGSVEYNLALGERRAKSVKSYLESLGVDPKRMTIISYGEEKVIDSGDSEDAHAKNRRANFVPLPK